MICLLIIILSKNVLESFFHNFNEAWQVTRVNQNKFYASPYENLNAEIAITPKRTTRSFLFTKVHYIIVLIGKENRIKSYKIGLAFEKSGNPEVFTINSPYNRQAGNFCDTISRKNILTCITSGCIKRARIKNKFPSRDESRLQKERRCLPVCLRSRN